MIEIATQVYTTRVHTPDGRDIASDGGCDFCRIRDRSEALQGTQRWQTGHALVDALEAHRVVAILRSAWSQSRPLWLWPPHVYQRCGYEDTD